MFAKPTMQNSTIVLYILLPVFFCFVLWWTIITADWYFTHYRFYKLSFLLVLWIRIKARPQPDLPSGAANVSLQINNSTTRKLTTEVSQVALFSFLKTYRNLFLQTSWQKKKKKDSSNLALALLLVKRDSPGASKSIFIDSCQWQSQAEGAGGTFSHVQSGALVSVLDDNAEQCEKLKWRLFVYF